MSSSAAPVFPLPIVFFEPDSEAAHSALAQALQSIPQGALVLGLIVKIERGEAGTQEKIVNWEFVAPEMLKSLALVLPPQAAGEPKSKE